VALLISGFGTPILLRSLANRRIGQQIRPDGPAIHIVKEGTPTMGGLAIIVAATAGYLLGHLDDSARFTWAGGFVMLALVAAGAIGFTDDWLKVRRQRSLGLNKRGKIILQLLVGVGFALAVQHFARADTVISFTRAIVTAGANAVNLTDGLDGLAAGASAFTFAGLTLIGYWQYRHVQIYHVHAALDLALAAIAMAGACVGFLWWNAAPARIFMGDTGSLAIGTALACLALEMNVQLLLPVLGGLFVVVTLSVIIQVISFRVFHTRVFRMAPIHHHFELAGWPETTVIVRFWIFSALCTAIGLGIFYADFLGVRAL
jgi:phospho-N-acetylmuramoyl-pentapeptide-transferase